MYSYLRKAYFIIFFLLSFLSEKIGKETASCISLIGWLLLFLSPLLSLKFFAGFQWQTPGIPKALP